MNKSLRFLTVLLGLLGAGSTATSQSTGVLVYYQPKPDSFYSYKFCSTDKIWGDNSYGLEEKATRQLNSLVKSATGQGTRNATAHLSLWKKIYSSIYEQNGKIKVKLVIPSNKLDFYVTTPDPSIGFGRDRSEDPGYHIEYDVEVDFDIPRVILLDRLVCKSGSVRTNITRFDRRIKDGALKDAAIRKIDDGIRNWVETNKMGGFDDIFRFMLDLDKEINEAFNLHVKQSRILLREMAIDENKEINLTVNTERNQLIITHPMSYAGILKRKTDQVAGIKDELNSAPKATNPPAGKAANVILNRGSSMKQQ